MNGQLHIKNFIGLFLIGLVVMTLLVDPMMIRAEFSNSDCPSFRSRNYFPRMLYENDGVVFKSDYLTMRDGIKIACDIYLPYRAVNENHKLPTLLHITRYNRSFKVNFP